MRWSIRLGVALAVAVASLAPASWAQASVRTPGATIGSTTESSTAPNCSYSLDTWPSTKGNEVTALHVTGAWACHTPGVSAGAELQLGDATLTNAQNTGDWIVGFANTSQDGASGSVRLDYLHPKTGHVYDAGLTVRFDSYPVTAKSSGPCSRSLGSDDSYICTLSQSYVVQTAPPVGPPPASAPVRQSVTVGMANGQPCELDLVLADAGPGQLSYSGSVAPACPRGSVISQAFAYTDQREPGLPVADGNIQCSFCSDQSASSGLLPAVHDYTVTYYVQFLYSDPLMTFTQLPPQCSPGGYLLQASCELTASVTAP